MIYLNCKNDQYMGHYGANNEPIWPIIKLVQNFVLINVLVKFERNPVKTVACIAFTTLRNARDYKFMSKSKFINICKGIVRKMRLK